MEDETKINFEKKNENFYLLCHHCQKFKQTNECLLCNIETCQENFCFDCLKKIYYKKNDISDIIEEAKENGWKCFKCNNKCLCEKCNSKNKIPIKKPQKINEDALLIESLYKGKVPKVDAQEMKFPYIPSQNKINIRLKTKLIKVAKLCEHYYKHKCKSEIFHKECLICHENEFHTNEIVRFKNSDLFLDYLRYCVLCMNDTFNYNSRIYNKNKKEILEYQEEYTQNIMEWEFHIPKIICKSCLLITMNQNNFLPKIKNIFNLAEQNPNQGKTLYSKIKKKKSMSKITKSIEKSFECFNNDDSNNNYYNNNNINNIFNFDSPNFNIINNKNYFFDELNFNSNFFSMDFYQNILLFNKGNNLMINSLYSNVNNLITELNQMINKYQNDYYNYNIIPHENSKEYNKKFYNIILLKYNEILNEYKNLNDYLLKHSNKISDFVTYIYKNRFIFNISDSIINKILIIKSENSKIFMQMQTAFNDFIYIFNLYMKKLALISQINDDKNQNKI